MFNFWRTNDFETITIPELSGASGQARVTFIDAPFLFSRSKNRTKMVGGDFGHMLVNAIYFDQSQFTVLKEWPIKSHFCRNCGAELDVTYARPQADELVIQHQQFEPFRLWIEVPAVNCPDCEVFNALDGEEIANDINEAMLDAFEGRNIK